MCVVVHPLQICSITPLRYAAEAPDLLQIKPYRVIPLRRVMAMDRELRDLNLKAIKMLCTHIEENDRSEETVLTLCISIREMADDLCRGHGEFKGLPVSWGN